MELHQSKKLLYDKRNNQQNEKTTYRMEKFANHISDKRFLFKIFQYIKNLYTQ